MESKHRAHRAHLEEIQTGRK